MPTSSATIPSPAIFREYDIRGVAERELTPDVARAIGKAYAVLLSDRHIQGPIAVGRDNRVSGAELRSALVDGLVSSGIEVTDLGEVPTPAMYWALARAGVAGGIQVTASHNPPEFNGFKLCIGTAALYGDDIQRILEIIRSGRVVHGNGSVREESIVDHYIDDVVSHVGTLAHPIAITLDGANGVAASPALRVLEAIGARVRCLFCESDGRFPNHLPDPSVAANLAALSANVRKGVDPALVEKAIVEEVQKLLRDGPTATELGETLGIARDLFSDLDLPDLPRTWIEGLPGDPDLGVRLLSELAR